MAKRIDAHVFEAGGYGGQHNGPIWGELDVGKYGEPDRERATIDFAEAVLKTGHGATWLAASIGAGSLSGMCTMPSFLATAVEGAAFYEVAGQRKQPWEIIGSGLVWAITPAPKRMINPPGTGRLQLKAKTIKVKTYAPSPGQEPHWKGFGSVATIEIAEGPKLGNRIADGCL